jgi:hypothetical protein
MSPRRELLWGVYAASVWNLGVAAFLNNPFQSTTRTWLLTLGAANELIGVLMIASPELLPLVVAVAVWLATRTRTSLIRLRELARRLIWGVHSVSGTGTMSIEGAASVEANLGTLHQPAEGLTLDELVDWLIKRFQEQDARIRALEQRQAQMPEDWRNDIREASRVTREYAESLVRRFADRHLPLRLLGLLCVLIGILLGAIGNLV